MRSATREGGFRYAVDRRRTGMRRQVNVNTALDRRYVSGQAGAWYRGQHRPFTASLIDRW